MGDSRYSKKNVDELFQDSFFINLCGVMYEAMETEIKENILNMTLLPENRNSFFLTRTT